jgi:hypothetical protein
MKKLQRGGTGTMTEILDGMLDALECSIERVRNELQRCSERDHVLRRLLRGLLDAQFDRAEDQRAAALEADTEKHEKAKR